MTRTLKDLLRTAYPEIEPSRHFETVFWSKAADRQKGPRFLRFLRDLEFTTPFPTAVQTAAFVLTAFLIGGTGGVVSVKADSNTPFESRRQSVQYLSGYHDFKGLPASSMAAAYFNTQKDASL